MRQAFTIIDATLLLIVANAARLWSIATLLSRWAVQVTARLVKASAAQLKGREARRAVPPPEPTRERCCLPPLTFRRPQLRALPPLGLPAAISRWCPG